MTTPAITSDPKVMLGKPRIAGTRLAVEMILRTLAAGEPKEQLLESHPRLTREGIRAALAFAADSLGAFLILPMPTKGETL
ncbi:MAG: DUF433 domain-containing protein [Gemmataceae bacterium]|nr:DUF433 domain-containing protein [Gemmataceae bacterium]